MTIKQFNASYLIHDDRLLFRINTVDDSEYRFWFTRRVTLFILNGTSHLFARQLEQQHTPEAAKAIIQFGQELAKEGQTTSDGKLAELPLQPVSNYPIGVDPVLVMDVKCAMIKEGLDDVLLLDLILPAGGILNLKMAGNTLHAMCALLTQLSTHANWIGSGPSLAPDMKPEDTDKKTPNSGDPLVH
jgi:hypothetical protein